MNLKNKLVLLTAGVLLTLAMVAPSLSHQVASMVLTDSGSAAAPAHSFLNDRSTGMYIPAANTLGLVANGVELFRIDTNLKLNSRNYTGTSGSAIGFQSKPNQTATTTGDVIGGEISPRVSDAGSGALIALRADPVVKDATSARTVSAVRGLEINIDLPNAGSAYTFTNDVSAIRIFPDFGSGHTFSGVKAILELAAPNTSNFDYFLESESGNATWIVAPGNTSALSNMGYLRIRHAGTTYRVPVLEDE